MSWLARKRDEDASGHIPLPGTHEGFVAGLGARNQRWVDGARALSPRLVTDLLRWAGEQLDAYLATLDLGSRSSAYWAGDAPTWFRVGPPPRPLVCRSMPIPPGGCWPNRCSRSGASSSRTDSA